MAESVQPLVQPPVEDIRNAAQIAQSWAESRALSGSPYGDAFGDVARLLKHALAQLGEPNFASIQAAATMLRDAPGPGDPTDFENRYARDTAAVILNAQLRGTL